MLDDDYFDKEKFFIFPEDKRKAWLKAQLARERDAA
jgi:hypothetical protein